MKHITCKTRLSSNRLLILLSLIILPNLLNAQISLTPLALFDTVADRAGNKYSLVKLAVNDTLRGTGDTIISNKVVSCTSGYFALYLEPGCGMENDSDPDHMARRNALCRVLYDVSQFIHSPLGTTGNKINVWVRKPANVVGMGSAMSYGTSLFAAPAVSGVSGIADNVAWQTIHSGYDGYMNLSPALASASSTFFHVILAFDFDDYTWHTDLTTSPSGTEYDLYSAALSQVGHALGFSSLISGDGSSLLGSGLSYYSRYDKSLQTHSGVPLVVNSGSYTMYNWSFNSAISNPGNILSPNSGYCVTDSTNCDTAVQYVGTITQAVYTPNCYEKGYSLSNFEDECWGTPSVANNNVYFVESNALNAGSSKRSFTVEERGVLCDLGYNVDTLYGDSSNLNFFHYSGGVCSGNSVAGINDGVNGRGTFTYFSSTDGSIQFNGSGLPAGIPGLLDNDINADAFEGLQVVWGTGSLSTTSGSSSTNVYYYPGSGEFGVVMLRYIPVNTTTGDRGNITYAYMMVSHDPHCSYSPCQLVINGDFRTHTNCGVIGNSPTDYNSAPYNSTHMAAAICNWQIYAYSPDLYSSPCGSSDTIYGDPWWHPTDPVDSAENGGIWVYDPPWNPSGQFMGMFGGNLPVTDGFHCDSVGYVGEGLQAQLAAPLIRGAQYTLEFDGRVSVSPGSGIISPYYYQDAVVQLYVDPGVPPSIWVPGVRHDGCDDAHALWHDSFLPANILDSAAPNGFVIPADIPDTTNQWHHIAMTFTYKGPAAISPTTPQFIVLLHNGHLTQTHNGISDDSTFYTYVYIANVSIKPVMITYPTLSVCRGTPVTLNPNSLVMSFGTGPADVFTWSSVPPVGFSCNPCPSPSVTVTANTVFTVIDSFYLCTSTDTVRIWPVHAIAISNTPCSYDTLKLFGSASTGTTPLTYSWRGPSGFTSTLADPTIYPPVAGVYTLTVTNAHGCDSVATVTVTVNPQPSMTGTQVMCVGAPQTFTVSPGGGTWSSSVGTIATVHSVSSTTGLVTGLAAGTANITYTTTAGCYQFATVTINPNPNPISGTLVVCAGSTTSLSDVLTGGTWSSVNTSVATIDGATGLVGGVAAGTSTISYILSTGCYTTAVVTVNPLPTPILGTPIVCVGMATTLSDATGVGTWSSSNTSVATAGAGTGVIGGVAAGTCTITYNLTSGCGYVTVVATVNPLPNPISGTSVVCEGSTITLSTTSTGGTWSSSNTSVATVDATSGIVGGVAGGTATISYILSTGCYATLVVTVNPLPAAISGATDLCLHDSTTLTDATGGGIWTSSDTSVAVIGSSSGVVTGVGVSTSIITYTIGTGCLVTFTITVHPLPVPITGPDTVCVGSSITLSDATGGGLWSTGSPRVTIGATTGIVTGVISGTAIVTYAISSTGCYVTDTIVVDSTPGELDFGFHGCVGTMFRIGEATSGGVWSSSNTAVATIVAGPYPFGYVYGVSAGTSIISYTLGTGCYATTVVTILALPDPITGIDTICQGLTTTLSDATPGGIWSSSNTSVASVDPSTGVVTGISPGTAIIYYTTDCMVGDTVLVYPMPSTISGTDSMCAGSTVTLSNSASGGSWSSSNTGVATIDPVTGVVTGVSAGTSIISYSFGAAGCFATVIITVDPVPSAIYGDSTLCQGAITMIRDSTAGGSWSSSNTAVATVGATTGAVRGISGGTVTITYTTSSGCSATFTMTINPRPIVSPITGVDTICIGATTVLSDSTDGGVWSTTYTTITTVTNVPRYIDGDAYTLDGYVTGLSWGVSIITYCVSNSCGSTCVYDTVYVRNPNPPILGAHGVCAGSTDTLFNEVCCGTWTSSDTSIATVDPATGVVTGRGSGTVIISYTASDTCNTFTVTTTIVVNLAPTISTNYRTACRPVGDFTWVDGIHVGMGCTFVCDSSIVRYYASGVAGSHFSWVITGGTIVTNYGDSVDVFWHGFGTTGTITLYDSAGTCSGTDTKCIFVIHKPHACFSASAIDVCLNDKVVFTDCSTADTSSPIVSWYWDFGDGHYASTTYPPAHAFTATGSYTITLTVTNECGCTDTARVVINVTETPGPKIECPSVVCEGDYANYSTSADTCGVYDWSVVGGTITSGSGTAAITVHWTSVGPDGYGSVRLVEPCASCPDTTTLKIPVILQNATIEGPTVACAMTNYLYSLPLWPATRYMWGVLGSPGSIIDTVHNDYKVWMNFPSAGTYTIHAWYENDIKLCGGNVFKTVTVVPKSTIIASQTTICPGATDTFTLSPFASGSWTITDNSTGSVVYTHGGTPFYYTFTTAGTYIISATGSFCADPISVTVMSAPAVDSVSGKDTVCLGQPYTYVAHADISGFIYRWSAIGGMVSPNVGDSVTVIWTATGTKKLFVWRENIVSPYCAGPQTVIGIQRDLPSPRITGPDTVCANSIRNYASTYSRGDDYDWTILPNTAGSVITGNHASNITVQWNNVTSITAAKIVQTVHKCGSIVRDTLNIVINPDPAVSIYAPSPSCPNTGITISAPPGGLVYTWTFGDGSPSVTGNPVVHRFPVNTTTSSVIYTIRVTVSPDPSAPCPLAGSATQDISILPGPVAYASTSCPSTACYSLTPCEIYGTVTNNAGALSWQWFFGTYSGAPSPIPPPPGTDTMVAPSGTGYYSFVVTASSGCTDTSNAVYLLNDCTTYGSSGGHADGDLYGRGFCADVNATTASNCDTLFLYGGTADSASWTWLSPPVYWSTAGNNAVAVYNAPGIYHFKYRGRVPCDSPYYYNWQTIEVTDTVMLMPDFYYELHCGSGGMDSIYLIDRSSSLPFWTGSPYPPLSGFFYQGTVLLYYPYYLGLNNVHTAHAAPGTDTITDFVYFNAFHKDYVCLLTKVINLPPTPTVGFVDSTSPICEGVPITFIPIDSSGILQYTWNFGDTSSSLLQYPQRTYQWSPSADPHLDTVTLTISDTIGCVADTSVIVQIYHNTISGAMDIGGVACAGTPFPINFGFITTGTSPYLYVWSNGDTTTTPTDNVYSSGSYWVTVFDANNCRQSIFPAEPVEIINVPPAQITGKQDYCSGDLVQLSGYQGPSSTYAWYRDGSPISSDPSITDGVLSVGDYGYELDVSYTDSATGVTCPTTSAFDSVRIHGLPPAPVISGPLVIDCNSYHLQYTATDASTDVPGTFNWSGGGFGTSATHDIYTGGPYRVWFTDRYGCVNHSDFSVPLAPDTWFPYFPSGCYTICQQQLPLTLYGPPHAYFSSWAWLNNGTPALSGSGLMLPYSITGAGNYQWDLNNGLCDETSDTMAVSTENCDGCQIVILGASLVCDNSNPASYILTVTVMSPAAGTTYTIGTDLGPVTPFSGTFASGGPSTLTLTYTTFSPYSAPGSVTVEVALTRPDGVKCFGKYTVSPVNTCGWVSEKPGHAIDTLNNNPTIAIDNSLLVYPNPSSGEVNVSFDYGISAYKTKLITVYDELGRRMEYIEPQNVHGNWNFNAASWGSGVYIIRMEADGKALQTQKLVITH